jgi:adenylate cyclase
LTLAKEDKSKVELLNDLAWEYKINDPVKARNFLNKAITLAEKLNYGKGEGQAYNNWGVVETIHGNTAKAIEYYAKALEIRQSLDDEKGVASLYNNIGNLYAELDSFRVAISNLHQSLNIRKELQDTNRIARVYYNLANTHEIMGEYSEALDYAFNYQEWSALTDDPYDLLNAYTIMGNILTELERWKEAEENKNKALSLAKSLKDDWEIAMAYNNLGNHKDDLAEEDYKKGRFEKAFTGFLKSIELLEKALALRQKEEDQSSISDSYNNLGVVYKNFGSYYAKLEKRDSATFCYEKALDYLDQALIIRIGEEDAKGMMETYNGFGDVKRRQKQYKAAVYYAKKCLVIAKEIQNGKYEQEAYQDLSKSYTALKDYKNALRYQKKYDKLRYQRLSEDRVRNNSMREALFGDFNKQLEIERKEYEIERKESELRQAATKQKALMGGGIALLLLALLLFNQSRIKSKTNKALEEKSTIIESERQKSEGLLLNILPEATAQELKAKGKTTARSYESVSVLFTDFKSFTQATEKMTADELVDLLDEYYRAFDEIISQNGIEKIKTIGDAYMCAAGLPETSETHALDLVRTALVMQEQMAEINKLRTKRGKAILEMRVGVNSGPVIAGVVGSKKFAYDIWGDTVNVAARIEAAGEVGLVNISAATYALVKDHFNCKHRGRLEAKNKGEMDMYYVFAKTDK